MVDTLGHYLLDYYRTCGVDVVCGEEAGGWLVARSRPAEPAVETPAPVKRVVAPPPPPAPAPAPVVRPVSRSPQAPIPPSTLTLEEKLARLQPMAQQVAQCRSCVLAKTRTQTVFGVGSPMAPVVFIGEAPGQDEDLQGEPFVGPAGKLLNNILAGSGYRREDIYIANALKCRPPGNREPQPDEIHLCQGFLFRQLEIIAPKAIFTLGRYAILSLLGMSGAMGHIRGKRYTWRGIPVVASYHPSYYLRTPSRKKAAWEDILLLQDVLDGLS
ncbi:MAG: uracil-DNA glycosylase [Magnetococcales bacterium]|nr:uracil-DNA glycosylase [Magnetococcales bacterium]NGZ26557.1 uracil-DNA glycosylase [Magnetococcales bacterium]